MAKTPTRRECEVRGQNAKGRRGRPPRSVEFAFAVSTLGGRRQKAERRSAPALSFGNSVAYLVATFPVRRKNTDGSGPPLVTPQTEVTIDSGAKTLQTLSRLNN